MKKICFYLLLCSTHLMLSQTEAEVGKNHLVRGKLGNIAIQLPPNFVRTHRSYITNRNFVRQVQRQFLVLMNGTEIPISRNFQKQWT